MGSPFSLCGVWQSPHNDTCSTKYFPRAMSADPPADCASDIDVIARQSKIPNPKEHALRFIGGPPMLPSELEILQAEKIAVDATQADFWHDLAQVVNYHSNEIPHTMLVVATSLLD